MIIQHKQVGSKGMFFVPGEEGELLAEMVYSMSSNEKMIIEHTEVSDELKVSTYGGRICPDAWHKDHPAMPFCLFCFQKKS